MHFKPKNYFDLCMAMKTKATVEIDGNVGTIFAIKTTQRDSVYHVTIIGETEGNEIFFADS